jgi:hypothetical protein
LTITVFGENDYTSISDGNWARAMMRFLGYPLIPQFQEKYVPYSFLT